MNKTDVSWLCALAFCLFLLGAISSLLNGDYLLFIIDMLFAAFNLDGAREWFRSQR
jgi:hypothetical protein